MNETSITNIIIRFKFNYVELVLLVFFLFIYLLIFFYLVLGCPSNSLSCFDNGQGQGKITQCQSGYVPLKDEDQEEPDLTGTQCLGK